MSTVQYIYSKNNSVSPSSFLDGLSIAQLLDIFNSLRAMASQKLIKSFRTKADAVKRVEETWVPQKHGIRLTEGGLVDVFPLEAKPAPDNKKLAAAANASVKPLKVVAAEKKAGGRAPGLDDALVITLLAEKNPCRPGTLAAARFANFRTGITVGEFVKACGGKPRRARRAVQKAARKGQISLA